MNHYWNAFPASIRQKILNQHFKGTFTKSYAEQVDLDHRAVTQGCVEEGLCITLTLLIDPELSMIVDCRYQCFGPTLAIVACELLCESLISKTTAQAMQVTSVSLHKALPKTLEPLMRPYTDYVLFYQDKQLFDGYAPQTPLTPVQHTSQERDPNFTHLTLDQKKERINQVIEEEIRPFLQMDNGDLVVLDLTKEMTLLIQYQGACISCPTSLSGTLTSIQSILRERLEDTITVEPVSSVSS